MEENFFDENAPKKLPGSLNVLTILTFIGSGIGLLLSIALPSIVKMMKGFMDKAAEAGNLTEKQLADMEKGKEGFAILEKYMTVNVIVGVVACILCIAGAVLMRKRKKDGYIIYLVGRIAPTIVGAILMGSYMFKDASSYVMIVLMLVMVILYTVNRKHLTN